MNRRLARHAASLALLAATVLPALVAPATAAAADTATLSRAEQLLVADHASARGSAHQVWSDLRDLGRDWSAHQATSGMQHNPNTGSQVCCWLKVAENVGVVDLITSGTTLSDGNLQSMVDVLMNTWMNSSTHRANILSADYDHLGIGVAITSRQESGGTHWFLHATAYFRHWDGQTPPPGQRIDGVATARSTDRLCADARDAGFRDVRGTVHEDAISCAVHHELTSGTTSTTYEPNRTLSRGQAATFLRRTLARAGHGVADTLQDHFVDDNGTAHERNINALASAGVLSTGSRFFRPGDGITRAEMAIMTARALQRVGGLASTSTSFFDDLGALASGDRSLVNRLAHTGVVTGTGPRQFSPSRTVSRAQMATFVVRALDAAS